MVGVYRSVKGKQLIHESYDRLLEKWHIEIKQDYINTRYGATHIITAGDKSAPALMLFHGVGDDSALMWIFNAAKLAEHFYIIAIDIIGGPGKSKPNENYGKEFNQILWIDDILSELRLARVSLAGVSYGAVVVQMYAAKRSAMVDKIVCMAGGLLASAKKSHSMMKNMMVFLPEALIPSKKNVLKLLRKLSGNNCHVFENDEDIMEHWRCLLRFFNNMAVGYHRLPLLSEHEILVIREKALYLIGNRDPIAYGKESIDLLEDHGMQYEVISGAGHGINHEFSDLVNQKIIKFLS